MKGDFSRPVGAAPKLTRVLMQQGRVQLDADWNELATAADSRARTALADLLGHADPLGTAAVPSAGGGFEVVQLAGRFFDGTTCVEVNDAPSLHHRREFSIEGWINPSKSGTIVARYDGAGAAGAYGEFSFAVDEAGRLVFTRVLDSGQGPSGVAQLVSTIAVKFGAYTHVAAVYDGELLTLYAGGVFAGSLALGHGRQDRSVPFLAGARCENGARAEHFSGYIESLIVWRCGRHHHRHRHRDAGSAHGIEHAPAALLYRLTPSGASAVTAAPASSPRRFLVTAGRAYVGGTACELAQDEVLELQGTRPSGQYLVYLEVWDRLVTAAEDPSLLDPALGGIDTSAVVRTEAQVHIAPYAEARRRIGAGRGHAAFAQVAQTTIESNQLVRVEVHHAGYAVPTSLAAGERCIVAVTPASNGKISVSPDPGWSAGQQVCAVVPTASGVAPAPALLTVLEHSADGTYALNMGLPAGAAGVVPIADVKWSTDNGSTAFPIASGSGTTYTIADPLERGVALKRNDYVEFVDDAGVRDGLTGVFATVLNVDTDQPGSVVVTVDKGPPLGFADSPGALIRRWDAFDAGVVNGVATTSPLAAVQTTSPIALGGGPLVADVNVSFTGGEYRTGDYWWAATRVDVDGIWGWPNDENGLPRALPPAGIERRYAPLAVVRLHDSGSISTRDLRSVFEPLTGSDDPFANGADAGDADEAEAGAAPDSVESVEDDRSERIDPADGAPDDDDEDDGRRDAYERRRGKEVVEDGTTFVVRRTGHDHHRHHDRELPRDALVLTRREESPEGYRFDGGIVLERQREPWWRDDGTTAPIGGPAVAAALGNHVYAFAEATGDLWRYDSAAHEDDERWHRCAPPPQPARTSSARTSAALVALGERLYLIGGFDADGYPLARCDEFDPGGGDDGVWSPCPPMTIARGAFGAAAIDGHIVVAGGVRRVWLFGWRYVSCRVESYVPGEFRWKPLPPLPQRREGAAAAAVGTGVFLVGGATGPFWRRDDRAGARVDVLSPFEGGWRRRAPLRYARRNARLALVDDALVVAGGATAGGEIAPAERYPLCGEGGEDFANLQRRDPGIAAVGGSVFALAGESAPGSPNGTLRCEISAPLYVHRREHRDGAGDQPAG